jgi:hypothetical protein
VRQGRRYGLPITVQIIAPPPHPSPPARQGRTPCGVNSLKPSASVLTTEHKPQVNRRALQKQEQEEEEEEEVVIISSCPLRDRDLASGAADIGWLPATKSLVLKEYRVAAIYPEHFQSFSVA